jgi:N-acetylglucosaminyldiphosphoundecaprenol N-acetyl-beta-D-mannosaminyltransferase
MIKQAAPVRSERVEILGIPVDRLTMPEALAVVESFIASREPHLVVTADSSGIVDAQLDPDFREILLTADLVTPDSAGILWASKKSGQPIAERVSGVDLLDRICALSADKGYRLFFLGAEPGVAEMAAEKLRLRHPGCNIVGVRHGFFPADSDEIVAAEVAASQPDVLFVALGIPRQEKFIKATQHIIKAPVAIGVGGSFDVFSGKTKRAPKIFQKAKLEWLWRLILNPKKLTKTRRLPVFVRLVLKSQKRRV